MNLPFFAVETFVQGGDQNQAKKKSKNAFRPVPRSTFPDNRVFQTGFWSINSPTPPQALPNPLPNPHPRPLPNGPNHHPQPLSTAPFPTPHITKLQKPRLIKPINWEPKMQRKKMWRKKWCRTVFRNNPPKCCKNTGIAASIRHLMWKPSATSSRKFWPETITRDAKSTCFKGSRTSCDAIIFVFFQTVAGKDHITWWNLPANFSVSELPLGAPGLHL